MDWVKLLLARVATALFWFNPLVWLLAREAHQLREEAADDAVLGGRHRRHGLCAAAGRRRPSRMPGLLLGAHGVAPSRGSLARRVARVLDGGSVRRPVARSFALGVAAGAILVAAPLAALNLTPGRGTAAPQPVSAKGDAAEPTGLLHGRQRSDRPCKHHCKGRDDFGQHRGRGGLRREIEVDGWQVYESDAERAREDALERRLEAAERAREAAADAREAAREARELAHEGREAARSARSVVRIEGGRDPAIDRAIQMKALGVSPEYVAAMRSAAPALARLDASEFVGMKAVGVTPDFAREMASTFRNIDGDKLTEARAVGVTTSYVREMRAAGVNGSIDDFIQLRAVGVRPSYVRAFRVRDIASATSTSWWRCRRSGSARAISLLFPPRRPGRSGPPSDHDPGG
jgi:hypothetical protein